MTGLHRRDFLRATGLTLGAVMLACTGRRPFPGPVYFVAPDGSDSGPGTRTVPWRTLARAISSLRPRDTLVVRGGEYRERILSPIIRAGRPDAPVSVAAHPGERPVLRGLLWLLGASYWTIDGLTVEWDADAATNDDHMVKLTDGVGWRLSNVELSGARSFGSLLIASSAPDEPRDWVVAGCCIHDTYPANGANQDHLVYCNSGMHDNRGLVERNVLFNAENGAGIKLGGPSEATGTEGVTVRYNTIYNCAQPVLVAWRSRHNVIEHNLLGGSAPNYGCIRGFELTGPGNVARDNAGFEADRMILNDDEGVGVLDEGGNVFPVDPRFAGVGCGGLVPGNPAVRRFGRHAPA